MLGYFGEHVYKDCGNCDNCNVPPEYLDGTIIAQKVCSAVARLNEKESVNTVVDVLRGSKNAHVLNKGHEKIKTFGAASDMPWLDLQQYIIQLINQGILEVHFHQNGRLTLTPLARQVLYEGRKVRLAILVKENPKNKKNSMETEPESELLQHLKNLRYAIAKEDSIPAYIVFSDATLKAMEKEVPHDMDEFSRLKGVGEAKLEKYGARFLAILKDFDQPRRTQKKTNKPKKQVSTLLKTLELYDDGHGIEEIAQKRGLAINTIWGHIIQLSENGEHIDFEGLIDGDELEKIANARDNVEDSTKLKSYYEYFNEEMPYWKLRLGLHLLMNP